MQSNILISATLTACLATISAPLIAAEDNKDNKFSIGLGAVTSQSIYVGTDDQTDFVPLINLEQGQFYVRGMEAGYRVIENRNFNLYTAIAGDTLTLTGKRGDSSRLKDMGDVDSGVNLKLGGELYTGFGILGTSIAQDISDEHDGSELSFSLAIPVKAAGIPLRYTAYANWMSEDLVNHYFGVSESEAKPGRAAYNTDAGWRYGIQVMGEYPLTEQLSLTGGVTAEWYSDEVSNSSIVEDDRRLSAIAGLTYTF